MVPEFKQLAIWQEKDTPTQVSKMQSSILQSLKMKVHIWHMTWKKGIVKERTHELSLKNKISIGKNMCTWERGEACITSRGASKGKFILFI